MSKRLAKRVLLVGWDAADWAFIDPMIERGLLPNLAKLTARGVMGKIATLSPMLSPMLWNSIATGKLGHKHGILGFVEPDGKGSCRPVASTSRQAKALWNILSQNGLRSAIVGWFASHPAEKINGCIFTDRFEQTVGEKANAFPLDPAAIHPPELFDTAKQLQVHPGDLHEAQVLPFVPLVDKIDQDKDNRVSLIAKTIAEATSIHNAATYLAEHEDWDLLAVYYDAVDHMGHGFMEYNPPKMDHVSDADFEVYQGVMAMTYKYHDMMLGRLMDLVGEETHILLLSDHGFHHGELRPKIFPDPTEPGRQKGPGCDPLAWHRRHGVFVLAGPGIKQDELVHGLTLLDVCPTILALLGLPVGRDMDGVVPTQMFVEPPEIEYIDSYEPEHPQDGVFRGEYAEDPYAALQAMQHLIDLGYVEKMGDDQAGWLKRIEIERKSVLAQVLYAARDFEKSEKLLREVLKESVTPGLACRLIMLLLDQQKIAEANDAIEQYQCLREDMPLMMTLKGQIKFMRGDFDTAFDLFQKASESDPRAHHVHTYLGQIHLQKRRYEMAEEAFRKVLAVDSDNAEALDGLGIALSGQGKLEDALFHHMQSAALLHHRWLTHYNMGLILLELGKTDWGIRAMETASELNPDFPAPHRILARVFRRKKHDADSALKHLRLLAEKRAKMNQRRKAAAAAGQSLAPLTNVSSGFDHSILSTTAFDPPDPKVGSSSA